MKLELKHLSPYLPYDLKGIFLNSIITLSVNAFTKGRERGYDISAFLSNNIKPILFPLSSLTKEITINGESFVPKNTLSRNLQMQLDIFNLPQIVDFKVADYNKLLEWKFDVFGLIEAGLAEPVTEDFNPYK